MRGVGFICPCGKGDRQRLAVAARNPARRSWMGTSRPIVSSATTGSRPTAGTAKTFRRMQMSAKPSGTSGTPGEALHALSCRPAQGRERDRRAFAGEAQAGRCAADRAEPGRRERTRATAAREVKWWTGTGCNGRRAKRESCIWIAHDNRTADEPTSESPYSRTEAEERRRLLMSAHARRVLVCADFAYGYPKWFAGPLPGPADDTRLPWQLA